ncbi:hypothetical protein HDV05_008087, partial [Chytridiales sp. JEL 0842]
MRSKATASFFIDATLCDQCYNYVRQTLTGKHILRYLTFAESHYYGPLSDRILDTCVAELCREGTGKLSKWIPLLPLYWFQRILAADALCVKSEKDRYLFVQAMILARRKMKRKLLKVVGEDKDLDSHEVFRNDDEDGYYDDEEARSPLVKVELPEYEEDDEDLFQTPIEVEIVDEEDAFRELLNDCVVYNHLPFDDLLAMRRQRKHNLVENETFQRAVWNQVHLKLKIERVHPDEKKLGVVYEGVKFAEHSVRMNHEEGRSKGLERDDEETGRVAVIPPADTEKVDAKTLASIIRGPIQNYGKIPFPPFRFSWQFEDLKKLRYSANRLYTDTYYFAGSLWAVYIQKVIEEDDDTPKLGVYLQRWKNDEVSLKGEPHKYVDPRRGVKAWFQIVCYFDES